MNNEEIQEEQSPLKCGCTPPTPEPSLNNDLNLIDTSEVYLECGCSKKKRNDAAQSIAEQLAKNTLKCGCTPPPPEPLHDLIDSSEQCLECGCSKKKKRNNLLSELLKEFDLKRPKPKNKPKNKPITQDCGCPVSTPVVPDCGCPVLTFAEALNDVEVKCGICAPAPEEQLEKPEDTKKVRPAELLEGLAQTSYQAGNIVNAPTKKEKHQAVCNLVGSILHLAAQVSKKELKNPSAHSRSIIAITHKVLNSAKEEHLRSQLFTNKPYLIILNSVEPQDRNQLVRNLLSNPEDSKAFLKELFETTGQYLATHKTTVQDALFEALQDLAEPEIIADQNNIDNQSIGQ